MRRVMIWSIVRVAVIQIRDFLITLVKYAAVEDKFRQHERLSEDRSPKVFVERLGLRPNEGGATKEQ